jgi:hypothetical protein
VKIREMLILGICLAGVMSAGAQTNCEICWHALTMGCYDGRGSAVGLRGITGEQWAGAVMGGNVRVGAGFLANTLMKGVVSSAREDEIAPLTFRLLQNYPNPFNPTTVISCQLPVVSHVRLAVYDLLGREVAVLVNERKQPGTYVVTWNAAGLSSGVYIYRLLAGSYVESRKMMLLK